MSDQVRILGGGYAYTAITGRGDDPHVRLSLSTGSQQGMDSHVAATLTAREARRLGEALVARASEAEGGEA